MDKPLLEVCFGKRDVSTLLDLYPDVKPEPLPEMSNITEKDRETIRGFAVFVKLAGRPPLPVEDTEE